ncbi:MAG TPA: glycosyltransferase [Clostridiales bacterium]|nr:glycosyltransferase [Clostridiales bacterium]
MSPESLIKFKFPAAPSEKTGWPWNNQYSQVKQDRLDANQLPRISIVTPSYNQADFLEETIRSVLLQDYPNLEYFIMDGGSTDGSLEIIKKYAPWLSNWESEKDKGQSQAINKGWRHCSGDIFCWLNSDDYLMPNTLFRVAEVFRSYPDAGFIHGKAEIIDYSDQRSGSYLGKEFDLAASLIQSKNPVAQPTTFISKNALLEVGMLDETLHMSMDWDLWIRLAANFPVHYVNETWAAFRVWSGTKSSNISEVSSPEHLKAVKKLFLNRKTRNLSLKYKLKALSANYARDAVYQYMRGQMGLFRRHMFLSLCLSPCLKERAGKSLIPVMLLGKQLTELLVGIKNKKNA